MSGITCYSTSTAINAMIDELEKYKQVDPIAEVSLLAPTALLCKNINRELLKRNKPFINVYIETPKQHILRKTEIAVAEKGGIMERAEMAGICHDIFSSNNFVYFKSLEEFNSYSWAFADCLLQLRLNIPEDKIISALDGLKNKGKDFASIASEYIRIKGNQIDYADVVKLYVRNSNDYLISFPESSNNLSRHEMDALGDYLEVQRAEELIAAKVSLIEALSPTHEVREILRLITQQQLPLDRTVVIIPENYLSYVLAEADGMDIPIRTNIGKPSILREGLILLAIIDILISEYGYNELKEFFYLQKNYNLVRTLSACGIAGGRQALLQAMEEKKDQLNEELCDAIKENLQVFASLEPLKDQPSELIKKIFEEMELSQNLQSIAVIKTICVDLSHTDKNLNLKQWQVLLQRRIEEVRMPIQSPEKNTGSLLVTTDQMPGTFEHVFCTGLTERVFPRSFREGPLLLDNEFEILNSYGKGNLKTAVNKNRREGERLKDLIGAAAVSWTGSYPRLNLMTGKKENKSPYLHTLGDIAKSINRLPKKAGECISEHEWLLLNLEDAPAEFIGFWNSLDSGAKAHLQLENRLWDDKNPELIGDVSSLKHKPWRDTFSPSQLDKLVACPYKWLIEKIYRINPLDTPENGFSLSFLTLGNLVHSILEQYLQELIDGNVKKSEARECLYAKLEKELSILAANLGKNSLFFLNRDRNSMIESIENYLKFEDELPPGRKPVCPELTFGHEYKECTYDEPVPIEVNGIKFKLVGSIDRLDRDGDTAWILDYKNSKGVKYKSGSLEDLAYLQPLLYCAALDKLDEGKGVNKIFGGFFPLRAGGLEYIAEYTEESKEHLAKVMAHVFSLFETGWFPINTEKIAGGDPCGFCEFQPVCGTLRNWTSKINWQKGAKNIQLKPVVESFKELMGGNEE